MAISRTQTPRREIKNAISIAVKPITVPPVK
jgi:hypothetical protein